MEKKRLIRIAKQLFIASVHDVGSLFSIDDVEETKDKIKKELQKVVPFVNIQSSTLGGKERVTIMITFSLDAKKDWANGILHNSRYSMMSFYRNGTIEQFSMGSSTILKKFRNAKAKSVADAVAKITKYINVIS